MDTAGTNVVNKLNEFFGQYRKRVYPRGQIIVYAGEETPYIYYVRTGKVVQYDITYKGEEVIVNIFKEPAFFSMSWALYHIENRYFFKAEQDTEVYIAPQEDVIEFVKTNPDVALDLLARVYKGLDGVLARAVYMMASTAKVRIMYELVLECRRFGTSKPDGRYVLSIGEKELAARAGLARETVSRESRSLKTGGIISISQHKITIHDFNKLQRLLADRT